MNKIVLGLLFVIPIFQTSCLSIRARQMDKVEVTVLTQLQIDNRRLFLTKNHAWVGPPTFKYELRRKNLFGRYNKIDYWKNTSLPDTNLCKVELANNKGKTLTVDKCKRTIVQD